MVSVSGDHDVHDQRLRRDAAFDQPRRSRRCFSIGSSRKKELALDVSLYTFLQILSVHSFEKTLILQVFLDADTHPPHT